MTLILLMVHTLPFDLIFYLEFEVESEFEFEFECVSVMVFLYLVVGV
jgi:hypothetical protein